MRHLLLFLHLLGFILWMGGGFAVMNTGLWMQRLARERLALALELQGRLMRGLVLPGAVLVVLTGLMLTLRLYGAATSVNGYAPSLMLMQGAGLLAAVITLVVSLPTMTRLARLDPLGPHAALFDALRRRVALADGLVAVLALAALLAAVLLR